MAIPVTFEKCRADYLLDCLINGKQITPWGPSGWVGNEILALAGACFFAIASQGPKQWRGMVNLPDSGEYREALEGKFYAELHSAIEFYGHLTMLVHDNEYDQHYEPSLRCLASAEELRGKGIRLISGKRPK